MKDSEVICCSRSQRVFPVTTGPVAEAALAEQDEEYGGALHV